MSFKLPEPIIDTLLDRLGNDDSFREAFVADTRAALASLGFAPAADPNVTKGIWFCLAVDRLASKEIIRKSHLVVRNQLIPDAPFIPFVIGFRDTINKSAA